MLRYFNNDCRMNWVDSNNVFVGFSDEDHCCEVWGADFYDSIDSNGRRLDVDLSVDNNWVFDTSFHDNDYMDGNVSVEIDGHCDASRAAFRLVDGDRVMYLVIWNDHNGYYAHGFDFCNGDTVIVSGSI